MSTQDENIFTIGQRFKRERERLNLSQAALAAKIFTSDRTIKNFESGATWPKANELFYFSREGADVQYVITGIKAEPMAAMQDRAEYSAAERLAVEVKSLDLSEGDADMIERLARRLARP